MKFQRILFPVLFLFQGSIIAQQDSLRNVQSGEIRIQTSRPLPQTEFLPDVHGNILLSGRKSHLIRPDSRTADLTTNQARQVFAKVTGITFWENDGSGIQTSIAARGLSPNRSWEFNVRQDGADISSDPFGYPEAYYSPPLEAVDRIELVRGSASLSFGPQFGGALNYRLKKSTAGSPLRFHSSQTLASFGTFNSFQHFSGSAGKFYWTSWFHHRSAEGWRENSRYFTRSGFVSLGYEFKPNLTLEASTTIFRMLSQQPGGLTDAMFQANPKNSLRSRNWLATPWNMASLNLSHRVNDQWKYEVLLFGNLSERSSIGFTGTSRPITVADTLNNLTGQYNTRQVDRDFYQNLGLEFRNLFNWELLEKAQTLSSGIRVFGGNTRRQQLGTGNTSSNFSTSIIGLPGRELNYGTSNLALYAEQLFQFGQGLTITPGIRMEWLGNTREGRIGLDQKDILANEQRHRLLFLPGITAAWKGNQAVEVYAGYSRAYRPVTFAELTPSASSESVDPALKDANGYNAEAGIRGRNTFLNYDFNVFYLSYRNRIGLLNNARTNIGDSYSRGLEGLLEINPLNLIFGESENTPGFSVFVAGTWMRARYSNWKDSNPTKNLSGKKVEYAPDLSLRSGLQFLYRRLSVSAIWNHQTAVYADASNTVIPDATAQKGQISAFQIMDASATLGIFRGCMLKFGVNNLLNEKYATRRSGGYPGPGLLPANPRSYYAGISFNY